MERLLSVSDICERYQCKATTARKYMRDMEHMEDPLCVTERALTAWIERKTLPPESQIRQIMRRKGA